MSKRIKSAIAVVIMAACVLLTGTEKREIKAESGYTEPYIIRCTCYCDKGITKSGKPVRQGVIAGKEEWLGKVAVLYEVDEDGNIGDYIGTYEFLDTGYGINGSLIRGTSVDVYCTSEDECWEFVEDHGDYVYMQILDGKG